MSKRVLLVDDEDDIRTLYKKIIEKGGYEVTTAKDGQEALKKFKSIKPDLVVLDIMMPEVDGWELAKKMRADPKMGDVPIIMLTVKTAIVDKMRSIEDAGADRHITKPVEVPEILSTIKSLLNEI